MKEHPTCSFKRFSSLLKANTSLVLLAVWGAFLPTLASSKPPLQFRHDLKTLMDLSFCKKNRIPDREQLWDWKIFDTSLEIQTVSPKGSKKVSIFQLKKASLLLARKQSHGGYAYGVCKNGTAWSLSVPSPEALIVSDSRLVHLNLSPIKDRCRAARVDFAPDQGGEVRRLYRWPKNDPFQKTAQLNPSFLGDGTLSITCFPKDKDRGPELWTLLPIHDPSTNIPLASMLSKNPESLKTWINELRVQTGLGPLDDQLGVLDDSGNRLAKRMSVKHNRKLIKKEKSILKKHNVHFIGENRVQGSSPQDMAWLLWNSPRHRKLLLNPKATHFSLGTKQKKNKSLAVFVFARTEQTN